jgi:hypothetical protein
MRLAIILLLLAVNGEMLAACGSTMHPAPKAHSAGVPGAGTTSSPITKPRALAFAGAVNLTAADVPGFTVSSEHQLETTQEKRLKRELLGCVGGVGYGRPLAEESSKNFELKRGILQLSVSSQVSVAQTPATAARELAAIRSAHVQACLSRYFGQLFKSQQYPGGVTVGRVSIASGTPPARGTTGGFGWRVTARLTIPGLAVPVPFYLDILGFVYGPSTVTLFSTGALRPFPAAAQQHLFSLLLSRAKGQRL